MNINKHNSGYLWPLIGLLALVLIVWWALGNTAPLPPASVATTSSAQQAGTTRTQKSGSMQQQKGTDIASVAAGISNASIFASWLASTGVASEVAGKGPYTLFVPTDTAIAQLAPGTFKNLSAAEQVRFVEYYVIPGRVIDASGQIAGTVQTLSRDPLNFTKGAGNVTLVGSAVIVAEYKASNGVVYVINTALIPPQKLR